MGPVSGAACPRQLGPDRFAVLAPPGCYLNHSCDPNAMRHGVTVFAWRPIDNGDEITIDYRVDAYDGAWWPCDCGSGTCIGTVVGSFFAMDATRQAALLPHAPAFIRREYHRRRRQVRPAQAELPRAAGATIWPAGRPASGSRR